MSIRSLRHLRMADEVPPQWESITSTGRRIQKQQCTQGKSYESIQDTSPVNFAVRAHPARTQVPLARLNSIP